MENNAQSSKLADGSLETDNSDYDAGPSNVDCIENGLYLGIYIYMSMYAIFWRIKRPLKSKTTLKNWGSSYTIYIKVRP